MGIKWIYQPIAAIAHTKRQEVQQHLARLCKPVASLGMLETLAVRLAGMQHSDQPSVDPARIVLFCADHGVAVEQVSAYPQSTTQIMVRHFLGGGAAIAVMARQLGVALEVVDVGIATAQPLPPQTGLVAHRAGRGSANFLHGPAMDQQQLIKALEAGWQAVERSRDHGTRLFVGGDMGVGNTTAAGAILSALLGLSPESVVGPGSGLDEQGMARKVAVIQRALEVHASFLTTPIDILRILGGFEIAALCGAYIRCGQQGIPVLVDGFVCCVAALVATSIHPKLAEWLIFAHRSAEPGQLTILKSLQAQPLLQLDMRLGEASGAAAAVPLLRLACALQRDMALGDHE
ncbi:MAG: nicotinate-nucleotide--dimethylbenzimidazole phosphoribosyltransferase [Magnetococcales bacterium]|nr:nicotinate-nucleotide--dimethylbenzimidazole phosphoribosyltransferase [Magnetococcales bacterium]